MILYKKNMADNKRNRPDRTLTLTIDELPERPDYIPKNTRAKVKFIKQVESLVRKSDEYKDYIKFLKTHMDMMKCTVLRGLRTDNGRRYTIEIHHEPFTLFDITEAVLNKHEAMGVKINPLMIADEVMELHYDEKVGLIPLSKTMHELVHSDRVFVPLQFIYHKYDAFFNEYEEFLNPMVKEKIEAKVELSLKCPDILSDILDTEFVYVNIDGFNFPEIPSEWKDVLTVDATLEKGKE